MTAPQIIDFLPPLDVFKDGLGLVCLPWAIAEGGENAIDVNMFERENNRTTAGEWDTVNLYESIPSSFYVFQAKSTVPPRTVDLA